MIEIKLVHVLEGPHIQIEFVPVGGGEFKTRVPHRSWALPGNPEGTEEPEGVGKEEGSVVQGAPAFEFGLYQRSYVVFKNLPKLRNQIIELEKKVADLSTELKS